MFSHIMIGTNDLARAKAFYDNALALGSVPKNGWHRIFTGRRPVSSPLPNPSTASQRPAQTA